MTDRGPTSATSIRITSIWCRRSPVFDESVEEEMIEFLEQHIGTFDLYGEIESVDAFVRYCFARAEDARTFHSRFAAAAHKAHLHAVSSARLSETEERGLIQTNAPAGSSRGGSLSYSAAAGGPRSASRSAN